MKARLLGFIARLREAGLRVSTAETLDAAQALAVAGLERTAMREALAASLVKDEADRALFDREFESCFPARRPRAALGARSSQSFQGMAGAHGRGSGPVNRPLAPPKPEPQPEVKGGGKVLTGQSEARGKQNQPVREPSDIKPGERGQASEPLPQGAGEAHIQGPAGVRAAMLKQVEQLPFSAYTELDYERALEAMEALERRFRIRLGRRLRTTRRGRVDIRRTLRASVQRGGALLELKLRGRRPRHIELLLLADISGSVRYASNLMLGLAAGASRSFRHVHSYVFIDRLAEAALEQGHLTMAPVLDLYARSDFGRVMGELLQTAAPRLNRATVLVILGDGRNNRRPPRVDLLRRIRRRCRAVVWLNPEPRERWGTGDSASELYAREVTALLECGNLRELEQALAHAV